LNYFGSMKTTIDIPEKLMRETIKRTNAKTKREAVITALEKFNRLQRLRELNSRLRGTFFDFMTQEDLKVMREDAKWAKTS
jgi:Arc/MetJ family transcription regulator